MSADLCPHGVNLKKWGFDFAPPSAALREQVRMIYLLDADACPDCLKNRIANLRMALQKILAGCDRKQGPQQVSFDDGLQLYYLDLADHLGPDVAKAQP